MSQKYAFSVLNPEHTGDGDPDQVNYSSTILSSEHWQCNQYQVPKDGFYHFAISFVRDPQKPTPTSQGGTSDDTRIDLYVDGKLVAGALAGETSPGRQSGFLAVTLELKKRQIVTTWDWTAKNKFRRLLNCHFTGFRL